MMKELFEKGYEITVGSPYGDIKVLDMDDVETYEDAHLEDVDHEAKTAYFYDKLWD